MKFFERKSNYFHFSKRELMILCGVFLVLWVFLFLKAALMGVYHDELLTYYYYVQTGTYLPPEARLDANNHFLNSALTHWSYQLFGNSPLALRLPNVLAYPFYFWAIFNIAARFKDALIRWSFGLSLVMCTFIFEYFAMTRGYALSMMLLATALWTTIKLIETKKIHFLIMTSILLWLSVSANLTILMSAVLIHFFILVHSIYVFKNTEWKSFAIKMLILGILSATFYVHLQWSFTMKEADALVVGTLESFYNSTIKTLSIHMFGFSNMIIGGFAIGIFWLVCIFVIYQLISNKNLDFVFKAEGLFQYLLIGSIIIAFIMAYVMGVNFPQDRTGMYLVVYFLGSFTALISFAKKWKSSFKFASVVMLFIPLHFVLKPHPAQSQNFDIGRHSDELYELVQTFESEHKFPLSISARGLQQLPWYYSNLRSNGDQGSTFNSDFPALSADLIFKSVKDTAPEDAPIYALYDSVYCDPFTNITCFKRRQFLERKLIYEGTFPDKIESQDEYYTFMRIRADSLRGKSIYIATELTLESPDIPFSSRFVAAVDGEESASNLFYDYFQLDWYRTSYANGGKTIKQGILIPNVPEEGVELVFYLWNQYFSTFSIRDGKCYLYQLDRDYEI